MEEEGGEGGVSNRGIGQARECVWDGTDTQAGFRRFWSAGISQGAAVLEFLTSTMDGRIIID